MSVPWPAELPAPSVAGYEDGGTAGILAFQPDVGPPIRHRWLDDHVDRVRASTVLTPAELAVWRDWYAQVSAGAEPFSVPRWTDGSTVTAVIEGEPRIEALSGGRYWRVSMELQRAWP